MLNFSTFLFKIKLKEREILTFHRSYFTLQSNALNKSGKPKLLFCQISKQ